MQVIDGIPGPTVEAAMGRTVYPGDIETQPARHQSLQKGGTPGAA
jgi:hypothetical protein